MRFPRASGVLLHLTSLPGPFGCGDLGPSAYHFVDWLGAAGQRLWQVLPIGSIGPGNSPYMSASAFAGNPLLIDLHQLATHGWLDHQNLAAHPSFPHQRVDYRGTIDYRMAMLRRAEISFFGQQQEKSADRKLFRAFCEQEKTWLDDYALFMALGDVFPGKTWSEWEPALAQRKSDALHAAARSLAEPVRFWKFTQWCFFRQWSALKRYAGERGVSIIGDVPIFVGHQCADVWSHQRLFRLGANLRPMVVAGVPPDYFSKTGQHWGNPLYDWDTMAGENYAWWVARLRTICQLMDIVRIDHFRGFASCWEIPAEETTAVRGHWTPGPGEKLFTAVEAALGKLPIVAEDLGVITPDVTELLAKLKFPGIRILQFAFSDGADHPFLPHNYAPNTVVYTGSHDNDTSLGWFASASPHERAMAKKYLGCDGGEIHWDLIRAAAYSVADMAIYPMQDVLGLGSERRMNHPGKATGCWEWRFTWDQVQPWHAERLYEIAAVTGRCAADRLRFADEPTQ